MKKIIFTVGVVLAAYGASAQGFYGDFSIGYGLGNPSSVLGVSETNGAGGTFSQENIYGSIGQGFNIALTPGYMFNEHIGVELGINYFMGATKTLEEETNTSNANVYSKRTAHSNQLRLIPSVIISTGTESKISGYAKGGLVLPVMGVTKIEINNGFMTGATTSSVVNAKSDFEGQLSLGFRGALGVNYIFNDKLSFFGELQQTNLIIKQKTNTFTEFKVDGVDIKDNAAMMAIYGQDLKTEFVDEITNTSGSNQVLAGKTNFNQFGINIGIKYKF